MRIILVLLGACAALVALALSVRVIDRHRDNAAWQALVAKSYP